MMFQCKSHKQFIFYLLQTIRWNDLSVEKQFISVKSNELTATVQAGPTPKWQSAVLKQLRIKNVQVVHANVVL